MDYKRADKRKHHYIYKTTCLVTGKWYIGLHSTDDLEDGYIGSGTYLANSIRKHGREQHICEILEHHPTRDAVKQREAELITWAEVKLKECMNLIPGGQAGDGWQICNAKLTAEQRTKAGLAGGFANKHLWSNESKENKKNINRLLISKLRQEKPEMFLAFSDRGRAKALSDESKAKRIATMKQNKHSSGEKNSQYGKCWISNASQTIKVLKSELQSYLEKGYIRGRKFLVL